MLIQPSIDELEEKVGDRALLATIAAKRAKDILMGKRPITDEAEVNPVSQAAKEISEGFITHKCSSDIAAEDVSGAEEASEELKKEAEESWQ